MESFERSDEAMPWRQNANLEADSYAVVRRKSSENQGRSGDGHVMAVVIPAFPVLETLCSSNSSNNNDTDTMTKRREDFNSTTVAAVSTPGETKGYCGGIVDGGSSGSKNNTETSRKRAVLIQTLVLLSMTLLQQQLYVHANVMEPADPVLFQNHVPHRRPSVSATTTPTTDEGANTLLANEPNPNFPASANSILENDGLSDTNSILHSNDRKSLIETIDLTAGEDDTNNDDDNSNDPETIIREEAEDNHGQSGDNKDDDDENPHEQSSAKHNDIIVVATVDGTIAGLSKSTGQLLWKRLGNEKIKPVTAARGSSVADLEKNTANKKLKSSVGSATTTTTNLDSMDGTGAATAAATTTQSDAPSLLLEPLISTTTTIHNSNSDWRTQAVPSIDGSVYLTAAAATTTAETRSGSSSGHNNNRQPRRGSSSASHAGSSSETSSASSSRTKTHDVTVTTSIRELVARSPFVDNRGRIYTGTRQATAFAIDGDTGEILFTVPSAAAAQEQQPMPGFASDPSWQHRTVVWVGRVDYTVSIHEPRSGSLDVQFSSAEIMSVNDMTLATGPHQPSWQTGVSVDGSSVGSRDHHYPQALLQGRENLGVLPSGSSAWQQKQQQQQPASGVFSSASAAGGAQESILVATPNGNVAYLNAVTGEIEWVAGESFKSAVAFAVDSSSGASLSVDILPDAAMPHGSADYLSKEMERQLRLSSTEMASLDLDERTLVGHLPNDQLFALPLGRRSVRPGLGHRHSVKTSSTSALGQSKHHQVPQLSGRQHSHLAHHHHHGNHDAKHSFPASSGRRVCSQGSPDFPRCLVDSAERQSRFAQGPGGFFLSETAPEQMEDHAVVPFYIPDYGHVGDRPPLDAKHVNNRKKTQKILRILGSWLAPTIALIFVVSFEMGRRKRQQDKSNPELESNDGFLVGDKMKSTTDVGVIQVLDDVILGYGGHGTVVYKGMLDGRQVAVKRMLRAYLASADREISLLIESDGHPNVVRYFLKEIRGDFVYLALELCDLSLHDLICTLRNHYDQTSKENHSLASITMATRTILLQIASGVKHLHHLRIVHRDLKPANILLADSRKGKLKGASTSIENSIYETFEKGNYVAKISDMGLGKQLVGQSSYGTSALGESSLRVQSNGGQSSIVGAGPGSVGWQAPEVMAQRLPSDASARSDGSGPNHDSFAEASPMDNAAGARTSRSVDIFSLGCIFYSTLVPGSHPFGEWYEREANIMHNRPSIDILKDISPDAYDLVSAMIQRNPVSRPTAKQICEHPFFWSSERRLSFLCDFSDRLETEGTTSTDEGSSSYLVKFIAVEKNAYRVVGVSWARSLDDDLISNVQRFRTYDPSSVRDLLRLIRNKHHHFDELPETFKASIGSSTAGLIAYFESRFPMLLIHCFNVCRDVLSRDDPLNIKYDIAPKTKPLTKRLESQPCAVQGNPVVNTVSKGANAFGVRDKKQGVQTPCNAALADSLDVAISVAAHFDIADQSGVLLLPPSSQEENKVMDLRDEGSSHRASLEGTPPDLLKPTTKQDLALGDEGEGADIGSPERERSEALYTVVEESCEVTSSDKALQHPVTSVSAAKPVNDAAGTPLGVDAGELIIWEGSTAAKSFNCRGWNRSDDDWVSRTDMNLRKRDANLVRCATDPKYRTRLCNHWDASLGTFCPMRKKNKCVFAHGPVELRVKEGKRHRWGKLVDKNGDNKNPKHSGGEDTYGAARSIESERKQEGKWNVEGDVKTTPKGKKTPQVKKKKAVSQPISPKVQTAEA